MRRLGCFTVFAGVVLQTAQAKRCQAAYDCDTRADSFCNNTYGSPQDSWICAHQQSLPVTTCTSNMNCGGHVDPDTHAGDGAYCDSDGHGQMVCYAYACCTVAGQQDNPREEAAQLIIIALSLTLAALVVCCNWSVKRWGGRSGARGIVANILVTEGSAQQGVEELLWRRCAKQGALFQSIQDLATAAEGALVATTCPAQCCLRIRPLAAHTCLLILAVFVVALGFILLPVVPALLMGTPHVFGCLCRVAVLVLIYSHKSSPPLRITWVHNAGLLVAFVASSVCFAVVLLQADTFAAPPLAAGVAFGLGILLSGNPLLLLRLSVQETPEQLRLEYRSAIGCFGSEAGIYDLDLSQFLTSEYAMVPSPYCRVADQESNPSLLTVPPTAVPVDQALPVVRAQVLATQLLLKVTVPPGAQVGQWLQVKGPGGEKLEVEVPEYALPGGIFTAAVSDGEAHRPPI